MEIRQHETNAQAIIVSNPTDEATKLAKQLEKEKLKNSLGSSSDADADSSSSSANTEETSPQNSLDSYVNERKKYREARLPKMPA